MNTNSSRIIAPMFTITYIHFIVANNPQMVLWGIKMWIVLSFSFLFTIEIISFYVTEKKPIKKH